MSYDKDNFKVVIVDDEPHVLEGLNGLVDWGSYQCIVVGLFDQTDLALEYLKSNQVDILFSDVRMPGMDGLEMVALIRHELNEVEVVMMSGYREFKYVQKAMTCKAHDYLLKPVFEEDLCPVLEKMILKIKQRREEKQYKEWYHIDALRFFLQQEKKSDEAYLEEMISFYEHCLMEGIWSLITIMDWHKNLTQNRVKEIVPNGETIVFLHEEAYKFAILVQRQTSDVEDGLVNAVVNDGEEIRITQHKIQHMEELKVQFQYFMTETQYMHHNMNELDIKELAYKERKQVKNQPLDYTDFVEACIEAIHCQDQSALDHSLARFFIKIADQRQSISEVLAYVMIAYQKIHENISDHMKEVVMEDYFQDDAKLEEIVTLEDLLCFLEIQLSGLMEKARYSQKVIQDDFHVDVDSYIQQHLNEPISIKLLAEKMHMHPAYLGQKLRKYWGESFTMHLNRTRIYASTLLLKNLTKVEGVESVSYEVGYKNYHTFLKYFKLYVGMTPKAYIQECINKALD